MARCKKSSSPPISRRKAATAHVIGEALKRRGVQVSRLARGVPIGSELEYVDLGTIAHALVDRRQT